MSSPAKTEVTVTPSLEGLIAWLETQPVDGEYDWHNCEGECLIGLYAASIGISWDEVIRGDENGRCIYYDLTSAHSFFPVKRPRTYGAALTRARTALSSSTVAREELKVPRG